MRVFNLYFVVYTIQFKCVKSVDNLRKRSKIQVFG